MDHHTIIANLVTFKENARAYSCESFRFLPMKRLRRRSQAQSPTAPLSHCYKIQVRPPYLPRWRRKGPSPHLVKAPPARGAATLQRLVEV